MSTFINLEETPKTDIAQFEPIVLEESTELSDDSICVVDNCDVANKYGCQDQNGYFTISNLFSELTDDYQRETAKKNLGIASLNNLIWGNISGNLVNQKDLYNFVTEEVKTSSGDLIAQINEKLNSLTTNVSDLLNTKANIFSPTFTGDPKTPTPLVTDKSTKVANTEWVVAVIENAKIAGNVRAISISPEYAFYGDVAPDVTITWDYYKPVTEQTINGIALGINTRTYTFKEVSTSTLYTLAYKYADGSESRTINFSVKYPIYYGTQSDYTKLTKTLKSPFTVTTKENEYIYVLIPNGSNTDIIVNSIVGGFALQGNQVIYNNNYYIYKSVYPNLGETTIYLQETTNIDSDVLSSTSTRELLNTKADILTTYTKSEIDKKLASASDVLAWAKPTYTTDEVTEGSNNLYWTIERSLIPIVTDTNTTPSLASMNPNTFYIFGTVTSLTITSLAVPYKYTNLYKEYMFQFTSDSTTAATLTLPSDVKWINTPTIEVGKTYQVSIVNNLAVIGGA